MGFLSKLFGKELEKAATDLVNGILDGQSNSATNDKPAAQSAAPASGTARVTDHAYGGKMPTVENQYNYNGTYEQYFENIFSTELGMYRMEKSYLNGNSRTIYTFYSDSLKVLVVELRSESCGAKKLCADCEKENVAYLRFYYDHEGWWNTKTYVTERLLAAVHR